METMAVSVTDFQKAYGNQVAVSGISFQVQRGEIFGLLGPNGAGKTTTLECLEGIRKPDGGLYREEVMGLEGFSSLESILYHHFLPPRVLKVEDLGAMKPELTDYGPIRHRAFATAEIPAGGDRPGRRPGAGAAACSALP